MSLRDGLPRIRGILIRYLVDRGLLQCHIHRELPVYKTTEPRMMFLNYLGLKFKEPPRFLRWSRNRPPSKESKARAFLQIGLSTKRGKRKVLPGETGLRSRCRRRCLVRGCELQFSGEVD